MALRKSAGELRGVAKVTRQITERKQVEEALRKSEQQFRATFEQAAVGIAHLAPDGHWLMVNQKLCDIVGYTREELLKRTFQDITYPEDLNADLAYVRQMLANEIQSYSMEKRYVRKDSSLIWINLTVSLVREPWGEPKYFISVIEDINNRKQAQAALHRFAQRLETLQEIDRAILAAQSLEEIVRAALSGISRLVLSEQSLVVLFDIENSQAKIIAEKLTGAWQVLQNATLPITDFIPAEVFQAKREKSDVFPFVLDYPPILQRHQVEEMGSYLSVPLFTEGNIIGELILATSQRAAFNAENLQIVSEVANQIAIAIHQAQLREKLQRKADELEQRVAERTTDLQQANAELEAFAYSISHDLRAPLRAMQGFSQALLEDYPEQLDSLGQEYAHRIFSAAGRMETLIEELLAYSQLSRTEIKLQPINLVSAVQNVLTQMEDELRERQVQVTLETPIIQVDVMAHRTTLVQVITNLLTNAIKFVAPGVQPQVRIWAEKRNEWTRLWVEDNGIGVAPANQERIFSVFERLHGMETYPGTGIGLAIVRKGIERMGGRVGVESQPGKGSQFWLELKRVT